MNNKIRFLVLLLSILEAIFTLTVYVHQKLRNLHGFFISAYVRCLFYQCSHTCAPNFTCAPTSSVIWLSSNSHLFSCYLVFLCAPDVFKQSGLLVLSTLSVVSLSSKCSNFIAMWSLCLQTPSVLLMCSWSKLHSLSSDVVTTTPLAFLSPSPLHPLSQHFAILFISLLS